MPNDRDARLRIAGSDIVKTLEGQTAKVFDRTALAAILEQNREFWRLTSSIGRDYFIRYLIQHTSLKERRFDFPNAPKLRYIWGDVPPLEVVLTLDAKAYCTHFTAMFVHNLTDQIPRTIYLNVEQPAKNMQTAELTQERIDFAFQRPQRMSKNIAEYDDYRVCLLNGMFTDNAGVSELSGSFGAHVRVTNIERTLIDIAVRPAYSGGPSAVLRAYEAAAGTVSVNRLAALLKKLNYTYPYHQAIGFYLDKAGTYSPGVIELLRKMEIKFDFYLVHGMKETSYDKKWRLFYPKGL